MGSPQLPHCGVYEGMEGHGETQAEEEAAASMGRPKGRRWMSGAERCSSVFYRKVIKLRA